MMWKEKSKSKSGRITRDKLVCCPDGVFEVEKLCSKGAVFLETIQVRIRCSKCGAKVILKPKDSLELKDYPGKEIKT